MDRLEIDAAEQAALTRLLDAIEEDFGDLESDDSLNALTVLAHELPYRIRATFNAFRRERMSGLLRISGYVVDQDRIGPTPAHWRDRPSPSTALREETLLLLFSSLLGDPFSWATQQNGRLIHDILPIKGHEDEQLASSSNSLLTWHTEDAFHYLRGDFVGFSCLRNPYAAATTIGSVDKLDLPDAVKKALFENRFAQLPDESHLARNNSADGATELFAGIEEMRDKPAPVAILFGNPDHPYIRADPYFISVGAGDEEAQWALDWFVNEMNDKMCDLRLESGDFCFFDNFRIVHGRKPFIARHDGSDRWLKRVNISCDLRKAQAAMHPGSSRSLS
jgi:Fe(II)/alpha-ketoglutarate-dependent arginine beta-hydroxylase